MSTPKSIKEIMQVRFDAIPKVPKYEVQAMDLVLLLS